MVNPLLDAPLALTDTAKRIVPDVGAAELRSGDGRRLLVSTQPLSDLRRYDRQVRRAIGKGAAARLSEFAATPLLGNRGGYGIFPHDGRRRRILRHGS